MDIELERKIDEAVASLKSLSAGDADLRPTDPVAKMMLAALLHETRKIEDYVQGIGGRIADRFCEDFIPRQKVGAMPAVAVIAPALKPGRDAEPFAVGSGAQFAYKAGTGRSVLNYIPLFESLLLPCSDLYVLTRNCLRVNGEVREIAMDKGHVVWVGLGTAAEIESLKNFPLLIRGTGGVAPERIRVVGSESRELSFATMARMEELTMAEPFDAQQSSRTLFSIGKHWRNELLHMDDAVLAYVTDPVRNRDIFKPRPYPRVFQHWLESEVLDCFGEKTVWLQLEFPEGCDVSDACTVVPNAMPVVNVDVNSLTLTQASPIAKLQKQEDAYFLRVLETGNAAGERGFGMMKDEIVIRDFDAACYHDGDLYREVRNLYNRFVEDYYAFIEYNGIKDGELIRQLKETINKIGKSVGVQNSKYRFDSGTYVMKNMKRYPPTLSTKVAYITTQGKAGNAPRAGETMENRKLPAIGKEAAVVVSARGGADKATADERYELLRYYALTNDRLYTKMDVEAFLRKEIVAEFGREEFRRIFIRLTVAGAGGGAALRRGLYVDLEFKDRKNYDRAAAAGFDGKMRQKIVDNSCLSMPVFVNLKNLEQE